MRWKCKLPVAFTFAVLLTAITFASVSYAASEAGLNAAQLVEVAVEVNPQVKAARAQWDAARHQILQNYAPADPTFTYGSLLSSKDFNAAIHAHIFSDSFQFPGEALLQADQAKRNAEIARLVYEAALRDLRANVEIGYYQILLDEALIEVNAENIASLKQVLEVTQIRYTASQAAQTDSIAAQLALSQAELQLRQYEVNRSNDEVALNQLLHRKPGSPLNLDRKIHLQRLALPLAEAVAMATHARQEILESALTEKNSNTAVRLAKMEYLPNYTLSYEFDYLLQPGAQPLPNVTQAHSFSIGFNLPVFFWIHQREDVAAAEHSLEAARYGLESVRSQTEANVTQLYQTLGFAYVSAQRYSEALIPLARQGFRVSIVAYQTGKVDFLTLSAALQNSYATRITYLQNANQFLAGRVALEQAIGAPLPQ
jgi:cobalt-zinc-cadmium efflux system outer membrane protein